MRELRELAKDPHDSITVLPGEQDVAYWNCVISGPDSTPYRNGGEHDLRTAFLAGLRFHTDGAVLQRGSWQCLSRSSIHSCRRRCKLEPSASKSLASELRRKRASSIVRTGASSHRSCTAMSIHTARSVTAYLIATTVSTTSYDTVMWSHILLNLGRALQTQTPR